MLHFTELAFLWKQNLDPEWNEWRWIPERKDEVMLGHVMLFAATKQTFKATNPEVTPNPRGEDLVLHNYSGGLEVMLLWSFGKYHYQGSNPCGGVAQAQA